MNKSTQKYNFCTIFDSAYYAKGLALYYSLVNVCNFHLYIFTPDEKCIKAFEEKNLPHITVIPFKKVENQELLNVKPKRDVGEYYWTIKASCIKYLFERLKLNLVTYIDTDSYFYSSPEPFFEELGNNSVLIVPHNFSQNYKKEIKNGEYNAGYVSFRNDKAGITALNWWNERSIEWCYKKKEDGKFGDQMYLNELSGFAGVHILQHKGYLANWNVQQYRFIKKEDSIFGIYNNSEKFKVVLYHFHYLKFLLTNEVELGRKYLSEEIITLFYKPYINYLLELAPLTQQGASEKIFSWKTPLIYVKRKIERTYNIIPLSDLIERDAIK